MRTAAAGTAPALAALIGLPFQPDPSESTRVPRLDVSPTVRFAAPPHRVTHTCATDGLYLATLVVGDRISGDSLTQRVPINVIPVPDRLGLWDACRVTTRRRFPGRPLAAWLGLAVLTLVAAPAAAQPDAYSAAEIRGWVVDAEIKQPVEGVHVVAQWILQTGMLHGRHIQRFHILETITDAKGEYFFAAWGPKARPIFTELDDYDPLLTFFKPGYRSLTRGNRIPHREALRTSVWHGQTIAFTPFRGTPEQWAFLLGTVQDTLGWGEHTDEIPRRVNDYWRQFPRVVLTILEQRRSLPAHVQDRVSGLDIWHVTEDELRALVGQKGP